MWNSFTKSEEYMEKTTKKREGRQTQALSWLLGTCTIAADYVGRENAERQVWYAQGLLKEVLATMRHSSYLVQPELQCCVSLSSVAELARLCPILALTSLSAVLLWTRLCVPQISYIKTVTPAFGEWVFRLRVAIWFFRLHLSLKEKKKARSTPWAYMHKDGCAYWDSVATCDQWLQLFVVDFLNLGLQKTGPYCLRY